MTRLLTVLHYWIVFRYLRFIFLLNVESSLSWYLKLHEVFFSRLTTLIIDNFLRPFDDFSCFHKGVFILFRLLLLRVLTSFDFKLFCCQTDIRAQLIRGAACLQPVFVHGVCNCCGWDQGTLKWVTFDVVRKRISSFFLLTCEYVSVCSWPLRLCEPFKGLIQRAAQALYLLRVKPGLNLQFSVLALIELLLMQRRWVKRMLQISSSHVKTITLQYFWISYNRCFSVKDFLQLRLMVIVLEGAHLRLWLLM